MKYKIQINHFGGDIEYREVEGEPFVIYGYEEFKFFKRVEGAIIIISEVTSGYQVGDFYYQESVAHDDIQERIRKIGVEKLRELIAANQMPSEVKA